MDNVNAVARQNPLASSRPLIFMVGENEVLDGMKITPVLYASPATRILLKIPLSTLSGLRKD